MTKFRTTAEIGTGSAGKAQTRLTVVRTTVAGCRTAPAKRSPESCGPRVQGTAVDRSGSSPQGEAGFPCAASPFATKRMPCWVRFGSLGTPPSSASRRSEREPLQAPHCAGASSRSSSTSDRASARTAPLPRDSARTPPAYRSRPARGLTPCDPQLPR